jgi:SAM-dependent methyltransferase
MKEGTQTEEPIADRRTPSERRIDALKKKMDETAHLRSPEEQAELEARFEEVRGYRSPLDNFIDGLLEQARASAHLRTKAEQQALEARLEEMRYRTPPNERTPEEQQEAERRLNAISADHRRREHAVDWRTKDNDTGDAMRIATESHEGEINDLRMWVMPSDRETWGSMTRLTERHHGNKGVGYMRRVNDVADLVGQLNREEQTSEALPDLLVLMTRDTLKEDGIGSKPHTREDIMRAITLLRNNPHLRHQPFIIVADYEHDDEALRRQMLDAGADLAAPMFGYTTVLEQNFRNIPDLLGKVEDTYGEQTSHSKRNFYSEYREKLHDRSKITADTEQEVAILTEIFQRHGVQRALDAGCGNGRIALPLAETGITVTGVDASEELAQEAKDRAEADGLEGRANFLAGDLRVLPIQSESEDAVMYNWHVFCDLLGNKSKAMVLREAFRALREGGVLVLDIPDREQLSDERDGVYLHNPGGEHIYIGYVPSEEEMKQHLENAGFTRVAVRSWKTAQGFPKLTLTAEKPKGGSHD